MPDQEAGIAGELVFALGNYLDNQFLGDKLPAGSHGVVECVRFVQLTDDALGIRGVRGLQRLERAFR